MILRERLILHQIIIQFLFKLPLPPHQIRTPRQIDKNIPIVIAVLLPAAQVQFLIDEQNLLDVVEIDYYMTTLN
jgi:hypothetical protein